MSEESKVLTCGFCGHSNETHPGIILVQAPAPARFLICTECAERAAELGRAEKSKTRVVERRLRKPSEIKAYLDQYIIGQEHAKYILSTAVYNHYKMLNFFDLGLESDVEIEKSNVMMFGPTGCGKTALLKAIAKMLDVPFAMADATNLTAAGYVGEDVENVVRLLVENADGDIERAQKGIIYIDEVDKLSRKGENPSISRDVGGEGVQQALLKIIEGTIVEVPPKGGRKHPNQECYKVDTSKILFIVGGSFEGIQKIIQKRVQTDTAVGFGADVKEKKDADLNEMFLQAKVEDFKKFGMLPEFLGRVPILCPLQELTRDELLRILTEPKNALTKQFAELVAMDNVQLEFATDALLAVADKAIERKTGARALRSILEESLLMWMFNIPDYADLVKMTITKECITSGADPAMEYKEIS